jgi:hypothetical protein
MSQLNALKQGFVSQTAGMTGKRERLKIGNAAIVRDH